MDNEFVGMWLSADHQVRKMLLPNGRFIAMLGGDIRHQGEYRIRDRRIVAYYKDGTLLGEGEFIDGVLHGGPVALYAEGYEELVAA
ncbi:MAG: hypothetical protein EOP22_13720 [Hyphomicrobiales bacterium]|nr:MAG: hypothetical protein EOP22_13720 [Hyphomicrobiales bacterium]